AAADAAGAGERGPAAAGVLALVASGGVGAGPETGLGDVALLARLAHARRGGRNVQAVARGLVDQLIQVRVVERPPPRDLHGLRRRGARRRRNKLGGRLDVGPLIVRPDHAAG